MSRPRARVDERGQLGILEQIRRHASTARAAGMVADRHGLLSTFYFLALTIVVANFFVVFTPKVATTPAA